MSLKTELFLDQTSIERIKERLEVMKFSNEIYSENRILKIENLMGVIQNKTSYSPNGCADYFNRGTSEGFILYSLINKDGYLAFEEEMKNYCIEIKKEQNIIIDKHNKVDTIRGFVLFEKEKIIMNIDSYNSLFRNEEYTDHKRFVVYRYE